MHLKHITTTTTTTTTTNKQPIKKINQNQQQLNQNSIINRLNQWNFISPTTKKKQIKIKKNIINNLNSKKIPILNSLLLLLFLCVYLFKKNACFSVCVSLYGRVGVYVYVCVKKNNQIRFSGHRFFCGPNVMDCPIT